MTRRLLTQTLPAPSWTQEGVARGTVGGRVIYQGKPLPAGIIGVWSDKDAIKTPLDPDGGFKFLALEPGEYRVTVSTEAVKKDGPPRYVPIPAKYGKPQTTDLKIKVARGKQTINVELK